MNYLHTLLFIVLIPIFLTGQSTQSVNFNKKLAMTIHNLKDDFNEIPEERRAQLQLISDYIFEKKKSNTNIKLTFFDKYNEQQSQLAQIWLTTAAKSYGIEDIDIFSAGLRPTQFSSKSADALKRAGFYVEKLTGNGTNVSYQVSTSKRGTPLLVFSKRYTHNLNPISDYIAIITKDEPSEALKALSQGAGMTFLLPYLKAVDFKNKDFEKEEYDTVCRNIGREMLFIMFQLKQRMY